MAKYPYIRREDNSMTEDGQHKVVVLYCLPYGKTKQWGIERMCHNWDWRIDLYFWAWGIWFEEITLSDKDYWEHYGKKFTFRGLGT